ncbi:MAG: DASS family sodium-coupled anion symporter [Spirochaetota bacterium]
MSNLQYTMRQKLGFWIGLSVFALVFVVPVPAGLPASAWKTLAVACLVIIWWVTEPIALAITSLLPMLLFPLLGVASLKQVAVPYASPTVYLFLGGFLLALSMERWGLHKRLGLAIIYYIGTKPERIVLGFMIAAALLSMWVSNTATAIMMLPVGVSMIDLFGQNISSEKDVKHFTLALLLGIAYAANIGGMGTIIGTPPNVYMVSFFQAKGYDISFLQWMYFGVPLVLLAVPLAYLCLTKFIYPLRIQAMFGGREIVRQEVDILGKMQRAEVLITLVFTLTVALLLAREALQSYIPFLQDAGIMLFAGVVLFVLPVDFSRGAFVLDWQVASKVPWEILLLFGGGLSLAQSVQKTGLADWLGSYATALTSVSPVIVVFVVTLAVVFLTELTSNLATVAALLPVLESVATAAGWSPLLLAIPATLAASCAFMMPIATPPNAVIYGSGKVSISEMMRAGLWLNLLFLALITLWVFALVMPVFGISWQ